MANGAQPISQRIIRRSAGLASLRGAVRPPLPRRPRCSSRRALKRRERAIGRHHESFPLPLTDPGAPPVISKRYEPSLGYHFVNLRPDRRGFHPWSEIVVDHNPTMIHQQIAVVIEVPTRVAVRIKYEKTHFTAAKDLPHRSLRSFMGRAPLDQDDIFKHTEAGQVLFQIFDDIPAR